MNHYIVGLLAGVVLTLFCMFCLESSSRSSDSLYAPKEDAEKVNCGTCRHWDPERQRCREEGKLKELGGGRCGDPKAELLQKNGKAAL